jgi:hypothetical protein
MGIKKMNTRRPKMKEAIVLLIIVLLVSTTISVFTPMTRMANAEQIGQIKVHEGFETWPPSGWTILSLLSVIQTTGRPGGECMVGCHAVKIFRTDSRFFCQMFTPIFNGKKGGGNILTFWHKQALSSNSQFAVLVNNGLGDWVQITCFYSSMDWTYETINLNDFIHPTKTMQVCFVICLTNYIDDVYIDEVAITGVSGP